MTAFVPQIGEGFAGDAPNLAHVNTVLGLRDGPVGTAWATALASPRPGHTPFMTVLQPGLPVAPPTLFVNKATIAGDRHGTLTWGAAQAGVAQGVGRAVAEGVIDPAALGTLVIIAAVWVDPGAADEAAVFTNNSVATLAALRLGAQRRPTFDEIRAAVEAPANPYFTPPSD